MNRQAPDVIDMVAQLDVVVLALQASGLAPDAAAGVRVEVGLEDSGLGLGAECAE